MEPGLDRQDAIPPYPAPPQATARRLDWRYLPPELRAWIEDRCGSPVVATRSQDAGFTPGFASVLTCADGSRHFVKAASTKAQRVFADSYREEGRKLALLPAAVPAPRLKWHLDADWVVLGIEHVAATNPTRPWRRDHLDATLDALEVVAEQLTPPPSALPLETIADELGPWVAHWDVVRRRRPELPHAAAAAELAGAFEQGTRGETVVHTDVRADNVLLDDSGRALLCDWNWPVRGAAWVDSFMALVEPRGDGLEVQPDLDTRPLLRDVPADHLDSFLALLTGYFLRMADEETPHTSPWIRRHQDWQGQVCWQWLCERRGWV